MVPKIVFHSRDKNRTTTVRTEREQIAENKVYDLTGPSGILLNENTVYEELTKVKTPFLLGVPRMISPLKDQVVTDITFKYFEVSEAIFSDEFMGKITHVEWQVSRDEEFTELIYNKIIEYAGDVNRQLPAKDINLTTLVGKGYVRARYLSNLISSPYTQPLRFKVANKVINKPKINTYGEGINIEFRVSDFSINPENGSDIYSASLYKLYKVPKDKVDDLNSYYEIDNKYLLSEFTKKATEQDCNKVSFPMVANDQEFKLVAGDHQYVLQVRHKGKIYTSEIAYAYIDASGLRVDKPELKILDNELNPIIDISRFNVSNGTDEFSKYSISIYEVNDKEQVEKLIHEKETVYNQYIIPTGVCKSLHTYKVQVIAHGTNYMESEPAEIQFSLKEIGIKTPKINLQNLGMEPKFTLDQFKLVNCKDTWVGTEWELYIHGKLIDNNLNPITSLYKVYWTEPEINVLQLIKTDLEPNTNYIMKVRYVGEKYKSNWGVMEFKSTELDIIKPKLYVSLEGLTFTMDVSEYIVKGATDTPKEVWYYVAELDTSSIEEEKYIPINSEPFKVPYYKKALSINKKNGIKKDTKYKIVAKIIGEYFTTPFTEPVYMTTENIYIKPPTVTITGYPDRVPKRPTITTSPFKVSADDDIHIATTYIIQKRTDKGLVDIFKSEHNTKNLTSMVIMDDILEVKTDYLLTVIHYGEDYGASDPVTINFRTRNSFMFIPVDGENGLQEIIIGSDEDEFSPKYFGKIPYEKLNGDRNYLGDWDNSKRYKAGEQVFYNGKLWYNLVKENENRVPGIPSQEGIHFWKEDDRQELPTYKWLLKHIGFPVGVKSSFDKLSEGYEFIGSYRDGVTASVDKFALGGRIIYVYDKLELENICYNDLVKMNLHESRSRTIRISNRLYWLRSLTSREYNDLRKLKKLDSENLIDIEIERSSYVSDSDQGDSKFRLVNNEFYKTEERNPLVRDVSLRLCLEYIPEEEEPWRYYKNKYPELKYDKYTDTGYFGCIEKMQGNIYNELGITTGTKINKDVGYLAFYSHGKRLLVNRMPIVFGIGYQDLKDIGVLYDRDMVVPEEYHPAYVTNLVLPDGTKKLYSARIMKGGACAYENLGIVEDNEIKATDNLCRYSEWNELLYRVSQFEPKHVDRLYSHGGFQIGSDWDNYDNINLGVFEHYSGNGCHVYVASTADNKYIMSRGGTRLEAVHWVEPKHSRNDYGLRLVLEEMDTLIPEDQIPINKPQPELPWVAINPNTVINTKPLDKFRLIQDSELLAPRIKYDDEFKIWEVNHKYVINDLSNEDLKYEETEHNNIISDMSDIGDETLLLINGRYYYINKIEKWPIKGDNVLVTGTDEPLTPNAFIFKPRGSEDGLSYGLSNRPAVKVFRGIDIRNEEFLAVSFYFGTDKSGFNLRIKPLEKLNGKKDDFLLSLVDENGNYNYITNYKYEVIVVNTAKSDLVDTSSFDIDFGINNLTYNEITKFNVISETIDVTKTIKPYVGNIHRFDEDYNAYYIPDAHLDKITDKLIGFKAENRDKLRIENMVNYSNDEVSFIKVGEELIKISYVNINSNTGTYTLEGVHEHLGSPYLQEHRYLIPNDRTVCCYGGVLYMYEGYRLKGINSEVNDLLLDIILTTEKIADTDESKLLYLEEHGKKVIKILEFRTPDQTIDKLIDGDLYQLGDVVTEKEDVETITNRINANPRPSKIALIKPKLKIVYGNNEVTLDKYISELASVYGSDMQELCKLLNIHPTNERSIKNITLDFAQEAGNVKIGYQLEAYDINGKVTTLGEAVYNLWFRIINNTSHKVEWRTINITKESPLFYIDDVDIKNLVNGDITIEADIDLANALGETNVIEHQPTIWTDFRIDMALPVKQRKNYFVHADVKINVAGATDFAYKSTTGVDENRYNPVTQDVLTRPDDGHHTYFGYKPYGTYLNETSDYPVYSVPEDIFINKTIDTFIKLKLYEIDAVGNLQEATIEDGYKICTRTFICNSQTDIDRFMDEGIFTLGEYAKSHIINYVEGESVPVKFKVNHFIQNIETGETLGLNDNIFYFKLEKQKQIVEQGPELSLLKPNISFTYGDKVISLNNYFAKYPFTDKSEIEELYKKLDIKDFESINTEVHALTHDKNVSEIKLSYDYDPYDQNGDFIMPSGQNYRIALIFNNDTTGTQNKYYIDVTEDGISDGPTIDIDSLINNDIRLEIFTEKSYEGSGRTTYFQPDIYTNFRINMEKTPEEVIPEVIEPVKDIYFIDGEMWVEYTPSDPELQTVKIPLTVKSYDSDLEYFQKYSPKAIENIRKLGYKTREEILSEQNSITKISIKKDDGDKYLKAHVKIIPYKVTETGDLIKVNKGESVKNHSYSDYRKHDTGRIDLNEDRFILEFDKEYTGDITPLFNKSNKNPYVTWYSLVNFTKELKENGIGRKRLSHISFYFVADLEMHREEVYGLFDINNFKIHQNNEVYDVDKRIAFNSYADLTFNSFRNLIGVGYNTGEYVPTYTLSSTGDLTFEFNADQYYGKKYLLEDDFVKNNGRPLEVFLYINKNERYIEDYSDRAIGYDFKFDLNDNNRIQIPINLIKDGVNKFIFKTIVDDKRREGIKPYDFCIEYDINIHLV